jgi:hypothetical protein
VLSKQRFNMILLKFESSPWIKARLVLKWLNMRMIVWVTVDKSFARQNMFVNGA